MAADPVLDYPRPDVEALLTDRLDQLNPPRSKSVTLWAYSSIDLGQPSPGWLTGVYVQVDVRASSKEVAFMRSDAARRLILALAGADVPAAVITRVDNLEGPFWLPDPDGCPRYVARYEIRVRPRAADRKEPEPA